METITLLQDYCRSRFSFIYKKIIHYRARIHNYKLECIPQSQVITMRNDVVGNSNTLSLHSLEKEMNWNVQVIQAGRTVIQHRQNITQIYLTNSYVYF